MWDNELDNRAGTADSGTHHPYELPLRGSHKDLLGARIGNTQPCYKLLKAGGLLEGEIPPPALAF